MRRTAYLLLAAIALFCPACATGVASERLTTTISPLQDLEGVPEAFAQTWSRTDLPVATGEAGRTWVWGPEPRSDVLAEVYVDAPVGRRQVLYYDKSRMEIVDPSAGDLGPWGVTNGLLVVEMVRGLVQVGDDEWRSVAPALINLAGDLDDPYGPTYASLASLLNTPPLAPGSPVSQRLDRSGAVTDDPALAARGVTAAVVVEVTKHAVAAPFWEFMHGQRLVWDGGAYVEAALFESPFYATGLPITEPYWTTVKVGGAPKDVLVQCFERRCLTYTPDNAPGWRVESGNTGAHYYAWRYEAVGFGEPEPFPDSLLRLPSATFTTVAGDQVTLRLEVVATEEGRNCGLMYRLNLPEDQGMLFVYDFEQNGGFWNMNTFIPLSLAWIASDGTIVDITDLPAMTPGANEEPARTRSSQPYQYVIEVNQGWFAERGIGIGDHVDLDAGLATEARLLGPICSLLDT
jgi:uncharacterized membrane protein (UPF0127 family)